MSKILLLLIIIFTSSYAYSTSYSLGNLASWKSKLNDATKYLTTNSRNEYMSEVKTEESGIILFSLIRKFRHASNLEETEYKKKYGSSDREFRKALKGICLNDTYYNITQRLVSFTKGGRFKSTDDFGIVFMTFVSEEYECKKS